MSEYDIDEILGADVATKLRRLMEAREEKDVTEAAFERAKTDYKSLEAEVWEALEDSPLKPPYKVDLGEPYGVVRFHPRETDYGRVIDKDKALDYLEGRAMVDEFTEPKIVMARVNELVREMKEQGETMPPGLDYYSRRFVTITREKN